MVRFFVLLLLAVTAACSGCHEDQLRVPDIFLQRMALRDSSEQHMLVSFGAGWCKPCRKEIALLNKIQNRFAEDLSVVGFLVEGSSYGSNASSEDIETFTDKDGQRDFELMADDQWKIFNSFAPSAGKRLPLLVLINRELEIVSVIQRAVAQSEEEDFIGWIAQELSLGSAHSQPNTEKPDTEVPEPEPTETGVENPTPKEDGPGQAELGRTFTMEAWFEFFEEAKEEIIVTYESSWLRALEENYFTSEEMPFLNGEVTLVSLQGDGEVQIKWLKDLGDTICIIEMASTLKGEYVRSTSQCIITKIENDGD